MLMAVQAVVTEFTVPILEEIFAVLVLPFGFNMLANVLASLCVRCQISISTGILSILFISHFSFEVVHLIVHSVNPGLFVVDMECSKGVCLYLIWCSWCHFWHKR